MTLAACSAPLPRTVPESSGDARTASHAEVLAFLDGLAAARDPRLVFTDFGTTPEGRALPLVIVSDPPVANADQARASGKPVVLVMANIHAGEVEGKEACLELLREVARGRAPWPLSRLVLLVAPIYNADGNDRFGPRQRPLQNGPALTGQRPNAAGLDLNRDYLKLESAEARVLLDLLNAYDPALVVDLHTTNGSAHGYELTYSPPLSPSAHPQLLRTLEDDWLPALRLRMRARHGYETYDYGNFESAQGVEGDEPDPERGWRTFDHRPRFGNNYVGLRNRLAILSEAYAYADFRTRIDVTRAFVTEILLLACERADALTALCARLDDETARQGAQGELVQATGAELVSRGEEPILLRGFQELICAETGGVVRVASGPRSERRLPSFTRFAATAEVQAPAAYALPPGAHADAIEAQLARHGLVSRRAARGGPAAVTVFRLVEASRADEPFQGHRLRTARWDASVEERELPAGTLLVPLGQPLARLAFQLLDPRADDGLVVWNGFDEVLDGGPGGELPVWLLSPSALAIADGP